MKKLNIPPVVQMYIGLAVAGAAAVYVVYRIIKAPFSTKGTPYESAGNMGGVPGAVAGVAAAADRLSGGTLSAAGGAIGRVLYDLTADDLRDNLFLRYTIEGSAPPVDGVVSADLVDEDDATFTVRSSNSSPQLKPWDGVKMRLQKDGSGKRFAVRVK